MRHRFTAILEPAEEGGFAAFCLELPEANGQGETEPQAIENLRSSIEFVLEQHREEVRRQVSGASHEVELEMA